jgi:hypothetical protein
MKRIKNIVATAMMWVLLMYVHEARVMSSLSVARLILAGDLLCVFLRGVIILSRRLTRNLLSPLRTVESTTGVPGRAVERSH